MVLALFLLQRFLFYLPKDYYEFSSTTETEKKRGQVTKPNNERIYVNNQIIDLIHVCLIILNLSLLYILKLILIFPNAAYLIQNILYK